MSLKFRCCQQAISRPARQQGTGVRYSPSWRIGNRALPPKPIRPLAFGLVGRGTRHVLRALMGRVCACRLTWGAPTEGVCTSRHRRRKEWRGTRRNWITPPKRRGPPRQTGAFGPVPLPAWRGAIQATRHRVRARNSKRSGLIRCGRP
jgi:hypothetical protein